MHTHQNMICIYHSRPQRKNTLESRRTYIKPQKALEIVSLAKQFTLLCATSVWLCSSSTRTTRPNLSQEP